ncbi:MAG: cytochrome c biogenesis protein ResB [Lacunisphaera sp.]
MELVLTDTSDPQFDDVVAIPEAPLARKVSVQHPRLPFRVAVRSYLPNATLQELTTAPVAGGPATQGIGPQIVATLKPLTFKQDERNLPAAYVELVGPDGSLGTWLVSPQLEPQRFDFGGRSWKIALRFARHYQPYTLTLLKFSHDRYPGTEIPRNFSSRLRLTTPDGRDDREVLIYMNNPLRYGGLTFYQAGFENNDRTTVLQVVRNPSWSLPYVACGIMTLGLGWQFGFHLAGFAGRRRRPAAGTTAPSAAASAAVPRWSAGRLVAFGVPVLAVAFVLASLFPFRPKSEYDLTAFGRLPTLVNGRTKPLDTVARTSLLVLQGRQRVVTADSRTLIPVEWLLDMFYRPAVANSYPVIEVVHPDVLTLLNLTSADGAGGKRFAFNQLVAGLPEIDRQSRLADAVESAQRTAFQRAVIQLRDGVLLYQSLQVTLLAPGVDGYLDQLARFDAILAGGRSGDAAARKAAADLRTTFTVLESLGQLRLVPPESGAADVTTWRNFGARASRRG